MILQSPTSFISSLPFLFFVFGYRILACLVLLLYLIRHLVTCPILYLANVLYLQMSVFSPVSRTSKIFLIYRLWLRSHVEGVLPWSIITCLIRIPIGLSVNSISHLSPTASSVIPSLLLYRKCRCQQYLPHLIASWQFWILASPEIQTYWIGISSLRGSWVIFVQVKVWEVLNDIISLGLLGFNFYQKSKRTELDYSVFSYFVVVWRRLFLSCPFLSRFYLTLI